MGLFAEAVLNNFLNFRDSRGPTNEDHLVNLGFGETRVLQRLLHWRKQTLNEVIHQLLELRASQGKIEVFRA